MTKKLEEIVYVSWEESERGWGTRPDGCSLHLTMADAQRYEQEYWSKMPDAAPDEYERPAGMPVTAYASKELYSRIKESDHGIRLYGFKERELVKSKDLVYGNSRSGWVSTE